MFNHCLTTDDLELALFEAMVALNNGVEMDDSVEFDDHLAANFPEGHKAICDAYREQSDAVFFLENPEYAE